MHAIRVLTWHVHGNYLQYLSQARVDFVLPLDPARGAGYSGRGRTFPFGPNVVEVPVEELHRQRIDCILFQTRKNWEVDQYEVLTPAQRHLPAIYLQHDPPWNDPVNERHWFDDRSGLLVHVTPFNALMWDSGDVPTRTIEHGIFVPELAPFMGEKQRGLVVVNHLRERGRRLGADLFLKMREDVPLDLVGSDSEALGGLGAIDPLALPEFMANYRFFFSPIRWTSLELAIVEAMMVGLPVVGLATTELATAIRNGESGFVDTDPARLAIAMRILLKKPEEARRMGENARTYARKRFGIARFAAEWEETFALVSGRRTGRSPGVPVTAAGGTV